MKKKTTNLMTFSRPPSDGSGPPIHIKAAIPVCSQMRSIMGCAKRVILSMQLNDRSVELPNEKDKDLRLP